MKDLSSVRNSASADAESAWVATLSNIFDKRCRFTVFWVCILATLLLIAPGSTSSAKYSVLQSVHVELPLTREEVEERRARTSNIHDFIFSILILNVCVIFDFFLSFLIPLPPFVTHPLSTSTSPFSSPYFTLLVLISSFSFSFYIYYYLSSYVELLLWLEDRYRALIQASPRGLVNLVNLVKGLFVEAWVGPSPEANLGREVRNEDAEEANRD